MRTSFDLFDICFIIFFNLQLLFYNTNYVILHHTHFLRSIEVFVVDDFEILIFFLFSFFPLPFVLYYTILYCTVRILQLPFPLNILLFPASVAEYLLMWAVNSN